MANQRNEEMASMTKEALALALGELMMAKKNCSITALCQRAGVSRPAFYRHFKDLDEVVFYYLILGWAEYCKKAGYDGVPIDEVTGHLIRYFYSKREFIRALKNQNKTYLVENLFRALLIQPAAEGPGRYEAYLKTYLVYSVIRAMIDNDFAETPEQVEAMLQILQQENIQKMNGPA